MKNASTLALKTAAFQNCILSYPRILVKKTKKKVLPVAGFGGPGHQQLTVQVHLTKMRRRRRSLTCAKSRKIFYTMKFGGFSSSSHRERPWEARLSSLICSPTAVFTASIPQEPLTFCKNRAPAPANRVFFGFRIAPRRAKSAALLP